MDTSESPLYREAYRKDHQPIRIGASLVIGPPGTRRGAAAGERVIELVLFPNRPATGVVFGTGEHATTRLALTLLEARLQQGDRVLDVGTGSGVLALAAAMLGARQVLAIDIDPLAVRSAAANVRLNGLTEAVQVRQGDLAVVEDAAYDVVLANILSPVIRQIAPELRRLLRSAGLLIAAGIIAVESDEIREALVTAGFHLEEERGEGDWRAFLLRKT